jgi:ribokinase
VICSPSISFNKNKECSHGIYKVNAVDTTAAGDTFTGYFIYAMLHDIPVPKALGLSSKASAIAVSRAGAVASIPFMNEVEDAQLDVK